MGISARKHRFDRPRFFARGLVVVFLLLAAGLSQVAGTPILQSETFAVQVTHPTHMLPGVAGNALRHEWVFIDTSVWATATWPLT